MMFPKPERKTKTKSNGFQRKEKKEIAPWRQGILSHHKSKPSKADRAEFLPAVVKEATERSKGICQYCKEARCATTHHVMSRGRSGRGVITNAYRVCGNCHINIEGSEERKQEIITLYQQLYGNHFYFDDQDHDEYSRRKATERDIEQEQLRASERLEPVEAIVAAASGRKLKAKERKWLSGMDDKGILLFSQMLAEVAASKPEQLPFGYGYFND
jgi:5-methylcytosine-specific restriction endonuclease McrA